MGHKMLPDASASAVSTDSVTDLMHEEMVITLLRHCQSMKRQETHLRLATGFVVLMGFVVIFFLHYQKHSSATSEPKAKLLMEPLAQAQRNPKTTFHLTPAMKNALQDTNLMRWQDKSNSNISSIRIQTSGFYYMYLAMAYRIPDNFCKSKGSSGGSTEFLVAEVLLSRPGYREDQPVVMSKETLNCSYPNYRTVYMGHLIQLRESDELKVVVKTNPNLIDWYTKNGIYFGAFLARE
ncbi:hypothetical protein ACEWY4_004490 [Coilia grayii]|uniref:THD domain-containing protein n=1 Tax=Coilia grayii TaxID=363190 RepID=A0ABD1KMA3_9TELE